MTEEKPVERRFIFNGSAVAFGGRIRRPDDKFLKAAGVAHLPVTGGFSESHLKGAELEGCHYEPYLKFSEAYSSAKGDYTDTKRAAEYTHGNHGLNPLPTTTTVESHLCDLQIEATADAEKGTPHRLLKVAKLEVNMQTTTSPADHQSTIRSFAASYKGITLATNHGQGIELTVMTEMQIFCDNETKSKLVEKYANDGEFRKKYASCFHPLGAEVKGFIGNLVGKHEIPHSDVGPVVATFVSGLQWNGPDIPSGTEILNNRLTIPGLGRLYFGEIIINDSYQRASLLRFELGSNVGGCATACEASSNGVRWPPRT